MAHFVKLKIDIVQIVRLVVKLSFAGCRPYSKLFGERTIRSIVKKYPFRVFYYFALSTVFFGYFILPFRILF